ncbi:MBL fold metallo-hydrolase [Pyruvatibacter sp.]|uniref:MBL fold metallo-hydrolase n=1 Tax=Pyruvatibacter sp. TaxID=1981328 RepID=UPI003266A61E
MGKTGLRIFIGLWALAMLLGAAYLFRTPLMLQLVSLEGEPPLLDRADVVLGDKELWADEFYTVEEVGPGTFVIAEPLYHQDVHSYLLIGSERALLIDTGSPAGKIAPVVASLTDKPVSVISSHLHYDHVGNHDAFDTILMPDLPHLRERVPDGVFTPTSNEHLGFVEGYDVPSWPVAGWWAPDTEMDLGNRQVTLLSIPGHTPESIAVWDKQADQFFMGDYSGDGAIYAFMPNSSLRTYLATTRQLVANLPETINIYAAHGDAKSGVPVTSLQSLRDLEMALAAFEDGTAQGTGFWPREFTVNDTTSILTDLPGPLSASRDLP